MLSGLPEIDLTDWKQNTEYSGYSDDHQVIKVTYHMYHAFNGLVQECDISSKWAMEIPWFSTKSSWYCYSMLWINCTKANDGRCQLKILRLGLQCVKLMVAQSPLLTKNWTGSVKIDPGQVKIIIDYIGREIFLTCLGDKEKILVWNTGVRLYNGFRRLSYYYMQLLLPVSNHWHDWNKIHVFAFFEM